MLGRLLVATLTGFLLFAIPGLILRLARGRKAG